MSQEKEEKRVLGLTKKQRSHAYTILFVIAFAIFFFVNNNFSGAKSGPYPPNYEAKINPASRVDARLFELPEVSGDTINLAEYKGRVVVLDFWATWAAPCREAIPGLIELKDKYPTDKVEIIGISLDTDTKEMVPSFVEQFKINYPVVYGDMNIARQYGDIKSIPTTVILDKKGRIYSSYIGAMDKSVYTKDIDKLLEE